MDNSLILKKWEGETQDTALIGLAQLLQGTKIAWNKAISVNMIVILAIRQTDVDDVREVLSYYRQFDDPIAVFRENQRKLQASLWLRCT